MPTYQYKCTECGHDFEQFQSFSDDALTECPQCGGRLRKLFNAVGVVFKGSGFYRTDSRSGSEKSGSEKSDSAPSATEKSGAGSSGSEKSGSASPAASSGSSTSGSGSTSSSSSSASSSSSPS